MIADATDSKSLGFCCVHGRQDRLEAEEETVGTDAFVEQQARDVYDFMMPDELRFVISFPDEQESDPSL